MYTLVVLIKLATPIQKTKITRRESLFESSKTSFDRDYYEIFSKVGSSLLKKQKSEDVRVPIHPAHFSRVSAHRLLNSAHCLLKSARFKQAPPTQYIEIKNKLRLNKYGLL
jgi:hypothetical protein